MKRVHSYGSCLCTFCTLDCCIWRVPKVRPVQNRGIVKPGCPSVGGGASMPDCCSAMCKMAGARVVRSMHEVWLLMDAYHVIV